MNIFEFSDYKKFVQKWVEAQPKNGHGIYKKLANSLGLSSVMISQVFKGFKNLSEEHAFLICDSLNFSKEETKYFLLLVQYEKASHYRLKEHLKSEIKSLQQQRKNNLNVIVPVDATLTEANKAIFYSHWHYSAIRLLTSIQGYQSVEKISEKLNTPIDEISKKLQFLVSKNLCVKDSGGYKMGSHRTHLEAESPYIMPRQISWRVKGFEKMEEKNKTYLFYTAPMSISKVQYAELRDKISELIINLNKNLINDSAEKLSCINIDLFDL